MKVIRFDTPTGQFQIPLQKVAEHRADYYVVEKEGLPKDSEYYLQEVSWVMDDDFEGIDWLINNSDFEDWTDSATKLNDEVNVTEDDFWCDSDYFVIVSTED